MLRQAVTLDESSAKMPVCGMEDAHESEVAMSFAKGNEFAR
jgi:hypothetical protein